MYNSTNRFIQDLYLEIVAELLYENNKLKTGHDVKSVRFTREGRNVMCFIGGASAYRGVNTFHLNYKNQSVNNVKVVCFEMHTKHTVHSVGRT
jgi:hypothetical protein